jgi:N-acetyl-anhydromuramyl-L-alanine amidase AmpD
MKSSYCALICTFHLFLSVNTIAQSYPINNDIEWAFKNAYIHFPSIPKGLLEAVAYTNTHFQKLSPSDTSGCTGIPIPMGVMGLIENGKNYFNNNLQLVSQLSQIPINSIKNNVSQEIYAYARALKILVNQQSCNSFSCYLLAIKQLDALPVIPNNKVCAYAKDAFLYQVYWYMQQKDFQQQFDFTLENFDPLKFFGKENFAVLSSGFITIEENNIGNGTINYTPEKSTTDYPLAISNPAASCNYSSRNGTAISAVTIHTIQGTYASCISWFQNCSASVSAHYVVRSSDGQITQMVREADKAWHVGSENPYTIGIEHEGYVADSTWYTEAMYASSANLVKDICNSGYGISPLRTAYFPWAANTYYNVSSIPGTCVKIKGHQHYPNQTHDDPGTYWNWDLYYKLINAGTPPQFFTSLTGTIYDSGGSTGNYSNDERKIYTIQTPSNAHGLKITCSEFSVENNWDYLYIYDGNSVFSPLIGIYTGTNSPGTIYPSSDTCTIEFRSDCATTQTGYSFSWAAENNISSANISANISTPMLGIDENFWQNIKIYPSPFKDYLNIDFPSNIHSSLDVFDVAGNKVAIFPLNNQKNQLSLHFLEKGIYFIRINEFTTKIVKE